MPGYRTHVTFGCLCVALLSYVYVEVFPFYINLESLLVGFAGCILGSIFPDIDTVSKMQRIFYYFATVFIVFAFLSINFKLFITFSSLSLIICFLKHRALTHNPIFILFLSTVIPTYSYFYHYYLFKNVLIFATFFATGSLSHIFLDFFVSKGLKK